MATVIDALLVTLGLDAKGFKTGVTQVQGDMKKTGDESGRLARRMETNGKQAAMFFSRMRNEALALLAVFTAGAGLKSFTANTITGAASLGRMSENLGMSTERLQAWQRAAERAGGSASGITAQLRESASEVAKFRRGMAADTLPAFFQFGGKVSDLRDGNTYLLARARIIQDLYKTDPSRAALAAQMMGISDDQFDLMRQGPAAIQRLVQEQEKRSSLSQKDARDAERLRNVYLDLRDTFSAVGTQVLIALIPTFEKLAEKAQQLDNYFLKNREAIVRWIDGAVAGFGTFIEKVDAAAQSLGGWKNVLIALAALKLLSIVGPMVSLAAALASIGASLGVIGGSAAAAGVTALGGLVPVAAGVAAMAYSKDLNAGEQETLAAMNNPAMRGPAALDAIRFFENKGYSRDQAVGIVANLMAESGLNPAAVGDGGKAYGVAQWHPDRQAKFKQTYGFDIQGSTVAQQLAFIDHEMRTSERRAGGRLSGAKDHRDAAALVMDHYERPDPKARDRNLAIRQGNAEALLAAIMEAERSAASGTVGTAIADVATSQAARAAAMGGPGALGGMPASSSDNSSHVTISGPVTITTDATDAQGLARDLGTLSETQMLVNHANTGMF